jgi:hypothetical protein
LEASGFPGALHASGFPGALHASGFPDAGCKGDVVDCFGFEVLKLARRIGRAGMGILFVLFMAAAADLRAEQEGFGSELAAYLNFDAAGAVADASVHRLGAETEGTGTSSSGLHGSARAFDGSGDRITLDQWTGVGTLVPLGPDAPQFLRINITAEP